eukprot:4853790-Prymnesium_polylepis.1
MLAAAHARSHDYDRATFHARTAHSIDEHLPTCARWNALVPQVELLRGGGAPPQVPYRELVIACGEHTKRNMVGWHDATRLAGLQATLPYSDARFDEVHWCPAVTPTAGTADGEQSSTCTTRAEAAADGAGQTCVDSPPPDAEGWAEVRRVLKPRGLLELRGLAEAPADFVPLLRGIDDEDDDVWTYQLVSGV